MALLALHSHRMFGVLQGDHDAHHQGRGGPFISADWHEPGRFRCEQQRRLDALNNATTRACVFLLTDSVDINAEGLCSVYEIRPKGCQTYPYVLNANDAAVLDDGCPHRDRFPEPPEGTDMVLLNLEERIVREGSAD